MKSIESLGCIRKIGVAAMAALGVGLSPSLHATVLIDGAGLHSIDIPINDNVLVDNRDAHVVVSSTIRGVTDLSQPGFRAALRTREGTAEVRGNGRIVADAGEEALWLGGGRSAVWLRDQALVQGDIVAADSPWFEESTALMRIYLQDQAVVQGNITASGYLRVEDQALVVGGIGNGAFGNLMVDMRGGVVTGALAMSSLNDYVFDMSGGSILGGIRGTSAYIDMDMSGGYIAGGLRTGASITGQIRGGQIDGGIVIENSFSSPYSDLDIAGGRFDAAADDWLLWLSNEQFFGSTPRTSTLDIWGGEFGYAEQGQGLFIDGWVDFNIWGRDLSYSNGLLQGFLQDGSWFSNPLTFGDNWHGTFTVHNVPEPATLGMLAACLIGSGIFGRRRAARN